MTARADVAVIGAGVLGLATAVALAETGSEVVVLERHTIGHPHGSSHGSARIFRLSYTDPAWVRLGIESLPRWHSLEQRAGETLLREAPAVSIGPRVDEVAAAMREGGAACEIVGGGDACRRFPMLHLQGRERVLIEPAAAVISAERTLRAMARVARAGGAHILEETPVTRLEPDEDGMRVITPEGTLVAGRVVVTAGSWAKELLGGVGIVLPVRCTRETVAYVGVDGPAPPVVLDWHEPIRYALPTPDGTMKAGEHVAGPDADPDVPAGPDGDAVGRVEAWLGSLVEGAAQRASSAETCLYTMTADEGFILERHGSVVVGSACSGHGFKFAPLVGEQLARLALG